MTGKRQISGQNWEFDGTTVAVRIAMTWKRRGGRKVIIAPDGGDAWAPANPQPLLSSACGEDVLQLRQQRALVRREGAVEGARPDGEGVHPSGRERPDLCR